MPHVLDAKRVNLLANGAISGHIGDMEFQWLGLKIINSVKASTTVGRWHQYWNELGIASGNFEDRAFAFLISNGFTTGTLMDKWLDYWSS